MKALFVAALVLAAAVLPAVATAEPQCLQVYPWSRLCEGDVRGFLEGMGVTVHCIAVDPWWQLCTGNVDGFVAWVVGQAAPLLP